MTTEDLTYEKFVRKLVHHTDPILHTKLEPFNFAAPPVNPIDISNELISTMWANKGVGLAANQLGYPYRAFALRAQTPIVCFNPRIVDSSETQILMEEGCLSYPFLYVKIRRPAMVKVRFQTYDGTVQTAKFDGITSRCFQHELDHLNGIDFTKRANPIHLEQARRKQKKYSRAFSRGELMQREPTIDDQRYEEYVRSMTQTVEQIGVENKVATTVKL